MTPKLYRPRTSYVEAVRLTADNWYEVACWCGGVTDVVFRTLNVQTETCSMMAREGEYIVRDDNGEYLSLPLVAFENAYEEVQE